MDSMWSRPTDPNRDAEFRESYSGSPRHSASPGRNQWLAVSKGTNGRLALSPMQPCGVPPDGTGRMDL
ncbi:hypothetical protein N7510_008346 [Penicillium lagena]|uniref:uncharacterized protein n=1 Tax=Penicillium lagena TaxID=94218 RepID=UPI0025414F41|nr:uncharacterized protein N7510_008346 [Penicillium lagena]KAJ5605565.1 hypothetical protein N7510_008346 [Penicillium lagena]